MRLALTLLLFTPAALAAVPPGADPVPRDPYVTVLEEFERRPLVAFLETHGSADQHRFLRSLVARPGFPARAVVVEFGSARYQVTIDRYVRGEHVARASLAKVWRRTTQISGVWDDPSYAAFFEAVRAANLLRAPGERIRVLLGDPPIDWRRIRTSTCPRRPGPTCLEYWISRRSYHYANVVLRKVLARGQKALLVAGAFHLVRPPAGRPWNETGIIERRHPGSVFTLKPHDFFGGPDRADLERRVGNWPRPSLAFTRGTWLGALPPGVAFGETGAHPMLTGRLEERIDGYLVLGPPP